MTPDKFAWKTDDLRNKFLHQRVCRQCKQSVKDWWYIRGESLVTPLRLNEFPKVGCCNVSFTIFVCVCVVSGCDIYRVE